MKTTQKITGGVYLVINPAQGLDHILPRLERSLRGGLSVVQIWDNWPAEVNKLNFIHEITEKAHAYGVPVLDGSAQQKAKQHATCEHVPQLNIYNFLAE